MACRFCSAVLEGECPYSKERCDHLHAEFRWRMRRQWNQLSETMQNCLLYWPRGHFTRATVRALRGRDLITSRNQLSEEAAAMLAIIRDEGKD